MRLLRLNEVLERVRLGRSTLYARIAEKSFPAPVKVGGNAVAWPEGEVNAWIEARIAERDREAV
ncbi:AlpA family transcriptional regulator [Glycocaulis profundi]|nr:AlpA family transcriptional regulator [Glycocaulis profundi]